MLAVPAAADITVDADQLEEGTDAVQSSQIQQDDQETTGDAISGAAGGLKVHVAQSVLVGRTLAPNMLC